MVRDFGIMFFQDFLLLVCVYLFLMPLHVMEKKKIKKRSDTFVGLGVSCLQQDCSFRQSGNI